MEKVIPFHNFTQKEILSVALQQSSYDLNCTPEDFLKTENVFTDFKLTENTSRYYKEPITGHLVTYGNNAVASFLPEYKELINEYMSRYSYYHLFETPNMTWLNERFARYGQGVCFMAEYWLPDISRLKPLSCDYELKKLQQADLADLYLPQWSNALCKKRKHLDILGMGAYENGRLIGLAGCSQDAAKMLQIGVDVLPQYRRQGVACALTGRLALEILTMGQVPFYCCAWSNMASAGNAVKSGFIPAWAQLTVKPLSVIAEMNEI